MSELVCIHTYPNRIEAELAKSLLDAEGIPAMIWADDAGGWRPELSLGLGGVKLLVHPENAERASTFLREALEEQDNSES